MFNVVPVRSQALRDSAKHPAVVLAGNIDTWLPRLAELIRTIGLQLIRQDKPQMVTFRRVTGTEFLDSRFGDWRKPQANPGSNLEADWIGEPPHADDAAKPAKPKPIPWKDLMGVGMLVIDLGTCQNNKRLGDVLKELLIQRDQRKTWFVCPYPAEELDRKFDRASREKQTLVSDALDSLPWVHPDGEP